jgi:polyphenol oxidase
MATTKAAPPEVVRASKWKEIPWLIHGFSTRLNGKTKVYRPEGSDLNLGFTASDDHEIVTANRTIFTSAAADGRALTGLVTLRQIHSAVIHKVSAADVHEYATPAVLEGDGLITNEPGILLGIQTADCIPILVADRKNQAVAAFHAGWRGTVAGIVEQGVKRMNAEFGSQPADLIAAIGPGIGPCCYTVGEEVRSQFRSNFSYADELFREVDSALYLDLPEANRRQLLAAGLDSASIVLTGECTGCATDRFFSHRIEHGFTGRMMSVIGVSAAKPD